MNLQNLVHVSYVAVKSDKSHYCKQKYQYIIKGRGKKRIIIVIV